uniref:Uncharacterized protein n=1 Tax=Rhizophora mucronata TaxID=61149 RepID=A0A2P2NYG2_RHIMU
MEMKIQHKDDFRGASTCEKIFKYMPQNIIKDNRKKQFLDSHPHISIGATP